MGVAKSLSIENAAAARRYLASVEAERARHRNFRRDQERQRLRLLRVQRPGSRAALRTALVVALTVGVAVATAWVGL